MQINDYPSHNVGTDDDLLLIWDATTSATKQIRLADLKAYFGDFESPPPSSTVNLIYQSDGDTNGVFYYIGTNKNTQAWSNPSGKIYFSASSVLSGRTPDRLADRAITTISNDAHTNTENNAWFKVDFGFGNSLVITHYTLQARNTTDQQPRNWKHSVSKDDVTYIDIDSQSDNSILSNGNFYSKAIINQTEGYRYFKLTQTGANNSGQFYFVLGEWELYGKLVYV